jgi:hypothetical protein
VPHNNPPISRYFLPVITVLLALLMIGTPLLFTCITRSVFEVNKLLALRVISLLIFGLWTTKTILDQSPAHKKEPWSIRLKKSLTTQIELPLIIWIVFNVLSTIFSQNIYISIIGAYDRWEGIITVVNYGFLFYYTSKLVKEKWQLKWLLFATLFPIVISSIYGVFQSLNIDFMPWSVDPSRRVFACINNPVHFCPYVGMALPFGISWILYLSDKEVASTLYHKAVNWFAYITGAILISITSVILYKDSLSNFVSVMFESQLGAPKVASAIIITLMIWAAAIALPIICNKIIQKPSFSKNKIKQDALKMAGTSSLYALSLINIISIANPDENLVPLWIVSILIIGITTIMKLNQTSNYLKHALPVAIISATWALSLYFSIDAIPISILSIIGWIIACFSGSDIFPNQKSLKYWSGFGVFIMIFTTFFDISQADLFILIAHVLIYITFSASPNWEAVAKRGFFSLLGIIYYAQFISFARATWIGFVLVMPLFYILSNNTYDNRNLKEFFIDVSATLLATFGLILSIIFNYHEKNTILAIGIFALVSVGLINFIRVALHKTTTLLNKALIKEIVIILTLIICTFIIDLKQIPYYLWIVAYSVLSALFLYTIKKSSPPTKLIINRICILLLFLKVQFISISITNIILYFVIVAGYFLSEPKTEEKTEKGKWLLAFVIIFGIIIATPTLPYHINTTLRNQESSEILAVSNAKKRVQIYAKDALTGTARTSMWLSSFPWIKDYWLLGSGLDTIKFMYPQYRRPEYGILEGGHNFTPDRLHNEYLNNLATKGIPSTIVYYIWLIGLSIVIVLKSIFKKAQNPINYVRAGLLAGAGIYLVQVLFNFGVVATMILFYVLLGLALAISSPQFEE